MKKLTFFFTGLLSLISFSTHAWFFNLTMLRHKETGQRVLLLGDIHVDLLDIKNTLIHRADLIAIIKELNDRGESVHCIVEDIASPVFGNYISSGVEDSKMVEVFEECFIKILEKKAEMAAEAGSQEVNNCTPMLLLEKCLRAYGFSCKNIDYRENDSSSSFRCAVEARKNMHENIKNGYIKEKLLDFMHTYPIPNLDDELRDVFMVDIAAIDEIYENIHVRNCFLCAGASHNKNIIKFLLSTGDYDQVDSFGNDLDAVAEKFTAATDEDVTINDLNLKEAVFNMLLKVQKFETKQFAIALAEVEKAESNDDEKTVIDGRPSFSDDRISSTLQKELTIVKLLFSRLPASADNTTALTHLQQAMNIFAAEEHSANRTLASQRLYEHYLTGIQKGLGRIQHLIKTECPMQSIADVCRGYIDAANASAMVMELEILKCLKENARALPVIQHARLLPVDDAEEREEAADNILSGLSDSNLTSVVLKKELELAQDTRNNEQEMLHGAARPRYLPQTLLPFSRVSLSNLLTNPAMTKSLAAAMHANQKDNGCTPIASTVKRLSATHAVNNLYKYRKLRQSYQVLQNATPRKV
ncbi:MAG TPA: hypothetical protein VGT41_04165 [Candidatus Babeliales bacterium]|nr:hypothetical protein [Candidatus Babeliales bacterium]